TRFSRDWSSDVCSSDLRPKQVLSKAWIPEAARPIVAAATRLVESVSASIFDQVVAATPAIAETYPARKTTLVQNYPIVDELQPRSEERRVGKECTTRGP